MSKETAMALVQGPIDIVTPSPNDPSASMPQAPAKPIKELDSARFAHLARKEAEIVKEKQALAAERDRLKPVWEQYQKYEQTKKENPIEALKLMGFSETDVFNYLANKEAPKEPTPEEKAIKAAEEAAQTKIKAWEEEQVKKLKDQETQQDKRTLAEFRNQISKTIELDKDKFEYINYYGPEAESLIYQTIETALINSKGTDLMSIQEAAELVENYYEGLDKGMANLKKRQPIAAPAPAPKGQERSRTTTAGDPNYQPRPTVSKARTLHSGVTATSAGLVNKIESKSERRERLIRVLASGDTSLLKK